MKQNSTPGEGCFHASYPNIAWEKVECKLGEPRAHTEHLHRTVDEAEVVGNGNDYIAFAKGLITSAAGIASIVKGVTSEKSVGVPLFGDGGILGPNEYTLQLNTNEWGTTSACAGHNGCHVWQQFVYATDYFVSPSHTAAVFIEYWLLDWGSSKCPAGWNKYETDCWKNSGYGEVPDFKITEVGDLELSATATAGGTDSILLFGPGDTYAVTGNDSVLDISSVWDKAEFNVLGEAGGSPHQTKFRSMVLTVSSSKKSSSPLMSLTDSLMVKVFVSRGEFVGRHRSTIPIAAFESAPANYPTSIANWKTRTAAVVTPAASSPCANRVTTWMLFMCAYSVD
jgi:hypothetical protein